MAVIVLTYIAQAAVTAYGLGAVTGFALGVAATYVGSAIDRAIFGTSQKSYGPRLSDLTVQTSTEGATLPILFGTMRFAGNVIWSTGLTENANTEEQGGMSGGGNSYTTYSYTTDAAVAICEGVITGVRRIWADSKLIYDVSETASVDTLISSNSLAKSIRIYTGTEDQLEDPLIQAVEGSAPAYRGTAYIVVEDLNLADFGNRLPNFTFEVVKSGVSTPNYFLNEFCFYEDDIVSGVSAGAFKYISDTLYFATPNYDTRIGSGIAGATIRSIPVMDILLGNNPTASVKAVVDTWGEWCVGSGISRDSGLQFGGAGNDHSTSNPLYYKTTTGYTRFYAIDSTGVYAAETGPYQLTHRSNSTTLPLVKLFTCPFAISTSTSSHMWGCSTSNEYAYFGVVRASDSVGCIVKFNKDTGQHVDTFSDNSIRAFQVTVDDRLFYTTGNLLYSTSDFGATSSLFCDFNTIATAKYILSQRGQVNWTIFEFSANVVIVSVGVGGYTICMGAFSNYNILSKGNQTLQQVCEEITAKSGLSSTKYDFSSLSSDIVNGYIISKSSNTRTALEQLMSAYNFDLIENDGILTAKKLSSNVVSKNIDIDSIGAEIYG